MGNIRKFSSVAEFENYRATDGWAYPAVNFVECAEENQLYYNNEFIMRWNNGDTNKTPTFLGDVSQSEFMAWVDQASLPFEMKKDGTDYGYLSPTNYALRSDNTTSSHISGDDKTNYFQFAEIQNINVGLFQNSKAGTKEVRFNFDQGCPEGFHKWFSHPYWNSSRKCYTKLIGRYNLQHNADGSTVDTCSGVAQSSTANGANWSANLMFTKIKATATATKQTLQEWTYWENLVMSYIFTAYYKTFNHQSIFSGLQSGGNANGDQWVSGQTDSVSGHAGSISSGAYRFMFVENATYGQQWIWGAGWRGENGKSYMTYDDITANKAATMSLTDADVTGTYPTNMSASYITKMDLWGVPTAINGSSSTGLYDGGWSNTGTSRVAYLGGGSIGGAIDGSWARSFAYDAGSSDWNLRGRLTLVR